MIGVIIGDQDSLGKRGQTYPIVVRSIFEEHRVKLTQLWKGGEFGSLYHALLMCEVMYPSPFLGRNNITVPVKNGGR